MGLALDGAGLFPTIKYRCSKCGEIVTKAKIMTLDGREYHDDGGLLVRLTGRPPVRTAADDPNAWEKWPAE